MPGNLVAIECSQVVCTDSIAYHVTYRCWRATVTSKLYFTSGLRLSDCRQNNTQAQLTWRTKHQKYTLTTNISQSNSLLRGLLSTPTSVSGYSAKNLLALIMRIPFAHSHHSTSAVAFILLTLHYCRAA